VPYFLVSQYPELKRRMTASLEQCSKHPLASAILRAAQEQNIDLEQVENISEKPGDGLNAALRGERFWSRRRKSTAVTALLPVKLNLPDLVEARSQRRL
jgi:cation transport ATPase